MSALLLGSIVNSLAQPDPNNKNPKRLLSFNADLSTGFGVMDNNHYGQNGTYFHSMLKSQTVLKGIPLNCSWGFVKTQNRSGRLDPFTIGFSRLSLDNFMLKSALEQTVNSEDLKNSQFTELATKLADYNYLEKVSNATVRYRQLSVDSVEVFDAARILELDSLKSIIDDFEKTRSEFQKLRFVQKTINDSLNLLEGKVRDSLSINKEKIPLDTIGSKRLSKLQTIEQQCKIKGLEYTRLQKVMSGFDNISIGYNVLNQSALSVYSYPFAGLTFDYQHKNFCNYSVPKVAIFTSEANTGNPALVAVSIIDRITT